MTFDVINNPSFQPKTGFTNAQFKKLDALYSRAAGHKVFNYRTVDCDFEEKTASYVYYKSEGMQPYLQFFISKPGPQTLMYEVYMQGKGRIAKSGVFDFAYQKLKEEIEKLLPEA